MENSIEYFKSKLVKAQIQNNEERVEKQHSKGKLTAIERINKIVDKDSFVELNIFTIGRCNDFGLDKKKEYGDGVITGCGKINGRLIYIASQDFTVSGGSMSEMQAEKIINIMDKALSCGVPFLQINDSGGARIQEGIFSLEAYGKIFKRNTLASGVIPQFSFILGPCAGGASYSPGITDFIFMVNKISNMFITGPTVIKEVTHEEVSSEQLGGAMTHNKISGNAHFYAESEEKCFNKFKYLFSLLPSNNSELAPSGNSDDSPTRTIPELNNILPEDTKKSYDMKNIILSVVDKNSFIEVQKYFAVNAITGFARLNNRTVGIVANQPLIYAGCLDINSSDKIARFVRFCDSFNIPLINFVDVPGFLPGIDQEYNGIIRHGAKILFAYSEATVPKISLIIRKAFGGAYVALCAKSLGYDRIIAWPTADIAVMGAEGAVAIIYGQELKKSSESALLREEKIKEYREFFSNPLNASKLNIVDSIIEPQYTRIELINALEMLVTKFEYRPKKKHGNIPL